MYFYLCDKAVSCACNTLPNKRLLMICTGYEYGNLYLKYTPASYGIKAAACQIWYI